MSEGLQRLRRLEVVKEVVLSATKGCLVMDSPVSCYWASSALHDRVVGLDNLARMVVDHIELCRYHIGVQVGPVLAP